MARRVREVRVSVVRFSNRPYYMLQWRDPTTGRKKTKSSGVRRLEGKADRKAAEREAALLEAELREGRYKEPAKMTWQEFCDRYENEHLAGLADSTAMKAASVLRTIERHCKPEKLSELTTARVSYFQNRLRDEGLSEDTIAGYLAHLKAALRWAAKMGLMREAPIIERPKRANGRHSRVMKGRPITDSEFAQMLIAAVQVVGEDYVEVWRHYLEGLWLSGLRLSESVSLCWDRDDCLSVDLSGKYPALRGQTSRDRVMPITPEFAVFLLATPEEGRHGRVFKLETQRGVGPSIATVSAIVSRIGKKAGIQVSVYPKTGKPKYASASDLRMSFCERWSREVSGPWLMRLMRHEDAKTTTRHCNSQSAEGISAALWEAYGQKKQFAESNGWSR